MVYSNHFDPILTPRKLKFWKKIDFFFARKTDKLSKNFLFFRKLTQIAVIFMVLNLNYHKNSQRYIEFNFGHKNNYFRLKSENFIILGPKLEIWRFAQFDFSSKPTENYHFRRYYITWGMKTHLLYSNFLFFYKKC